MYVYTSVYAYIYVHVLFCGFSTFADTNVYFHLYTFPHIHIYHYISAHRSSLYTHVYIDFWCGDEEATIRRLPILSGLFGEKSPIFVELFRNRDPAI